MMPPDRRNSRRNSSVTLDALWPLFDVLQPPPDIKGGVTPLASPGRNTCVTPHAVPDRRLDRRNSYVTVLRQRNVTHSPPLRGSVTTLVTADQKGHPDE